LAFDEGGSDGSFGFNFEFCVGARRVEEQLEIYFGPVKKLDYDVGKIVIFYCRRSQCYVE
jgi:hypothetical protein